MRCAKGSSEVRDRPRAHGVPGAYAQGSPRHAAQFDAATRARPGNAALARLAQTRAGILADGSVHPAIAAAIRADAGGGRSLGSKTSSWARESFGEAVKDARVHTGGLAQALARAVSARAFTVGRDVFFAAGEYRPHAAAGRRLLAHELAHVVQQHGATFGPSLHATRPADAHERAADAAAETAGEAGGG
jgi:Domain of unknown function (DUF4157)